MPAKAAPAPMPRAGWMVSGVLIAGLGCWVWHDPYSSLTVTGLVMVLLWASALHDRRAMRRLAAERAGESLCTFARSFDRRRTDTWILRAVYEELSELLWVDGTAIPLRAADHCENDLFIDPEDLDEMAQTIASRAARSLEGTEHNPLYGKVRTVGDLVAFFHHQPSLEHGAVIHVR